MAGWTLTQIRQFAAREAGKFHVGTATSGSSTSILEDTTYPVKSSIRSAQLFQDYWIGRPVAVAAGDKIRLTATYAPTTGQLTPDLAYTNAPYANSVGEAYELHGMFPPYGNYETSWTTFINDGLKSCLVPIEYTLTPSSATVSRFTLASAIPWLSDPWYVRKAGVLSSGVNREANDPYLIRPINGFATVFMDGVTPYLNTYPMTFQTTDTIYLYVLTPAYYAIQAAGSGPYTQTGMTLETDVAPLDNLELGAYAALAEAWRRQGQVLDQAVAGRTVNSQRDAVARFNEYSPEWNLRVPMQLKRRRNWGPMSATTTGVVSGWSHG